MPFKMISFDLNTFITLFLINQVESFRDEYSLSRVLAWKFNIIEIEDIIRKANEEELIIESVEKGISNFIVSNIGKLYIEDYMTECENLMFESFPSELDFLLLLFRPNKK